MQKKFFAWLIVSLILISVPALNLNAAGGGFSDIGDHWAKALIEKFTEQGLLAGYPDGTFRPDGYLQRAEAVTLLNRFFNITEGGYPSFVDVRPDHWYYFQVGAAQGKGYVAGFPDGTFRATEYVTRLQAFVMIYRLLGEPEVYNTDLSRFTDHHQIPTDQAIYRQVVSYMVGNDIVRAYPDGSLGVNRFITRAEMLSLLNNLGDMIANENSISDENVPSIYDPQREDEELPYEVTPEPEPEKTTTNDPVNNNIGNGWPAPRPPGHITHRTTRAALGTEGIGDSEVMEAPDPEAEEDLEAEEDAEAEEEGKTDIALS